MNPTFITIGQHLDNVARRAQEAGDKAILDCSQMLQYMRDASDSGRMQHKDDVERLEAKADRAHVELELAVNKMKQLECAAREIRARLGMFERMP